MKTNDIILLSIVGVGAYFLFSKSNSSSGQSISETKTIYETIRETGSNIRDVFSTTKESVGNSIEIVKDVAGTIAAVGQRVASDIGKVGEVTALLPDVASLSAGIEPSSSARAVRMGGGFLKLGGGTGIIDIGSGIAIQIADRLSPDVSKTLREKASSILSAVSMPSPLVILPATETKAVKIIAEKTKNLLKSGASKLKSLF